MAEEYLDDENDFSEAIELPVEEASRNDGIGNDVSVEESSATTTTKFARIRKTAKSKNNILVTLQQEALESKIEVNRLRAEYYKRKLDKYKTTETNTMPPSLDEG